MPLPIGPSHWWASAFWLLNAKGGRTYSQLQWPEKAAWKTHRARRTKESTGQRIWRVTGGREESQLPGMRGLLLRGGCLAEHRGPRREEHSGDCSLLLMPASGAVPYITCLHPSFLELCQMPHPATCRRWLAGSLPPLQVTLVIWFTAVAQLNCRDSFLAPAHLDKWPRYVVLWPFPPQAQRLFARDR